MKKILLFAVALLVLSTFFLTGCKKDGLSIKPKSTDSTVTTLATGSSYYYVTTDNSGNLYALGLGGTTIYKYDIHNGKTPFYTLPQGTGNDTTVINRMECLTSDSLGNIYTLSVNNAGTANVLKITTSGSASTIFSDINPDKELPVQYIGTYNETFYFSTQAGIYKIASGGSPQFLISNVSANFAIDKNGNVIYATYAQPNNAGESSLSQISPQGVQSVIVANLYNTGNTGNYVTTIVIDKFGDIYAYITTSSFVLLKVNAAAKISTVMTGALGNVDGLFGAAEIGGAFNMVADPTGNIYFTQTNNDGSESYLRKITF
ncbi:hypothetical protein [Mucilaginibacter sp. L196]|uniref:hypothetical protein n=1 Tax=Mucilaginibacter sp. L196 TaxID=1641870 RepID=UPI00131CA423|nr:hypothetical protein [Mucilaginibacter sp. L196]